MSQSKIYSPRIQEDLIPILWKISKFKKKPMTKVVDEILRPELVRLSAEITRSLELNPPMRDIQKEKEMEEM